MSEPPTTQPGDVWLLGPHRLICGDGGNGDVAGRVLEGGLVPNIMVTDPPYGVEYDPAWPEKYFGGDKRVDRALAHDDRASWSTAFRHFSGDVLYCWASATRADEFVSSIVASGFEIRAEIIWGKNRMAVSRGHYHWQHKPCWYAVRKDGKAN